MATVQTVFGRPDFAAARHGDLPARGGAARAARRGRLAAGPPLESARAGGGARRPKAKAKSVIQIWMWGGPSHLDTFDPKPEAGYDYCGPLDKPIATNVDGIRICELMPLLAKQADKYSIIRSMTHGINAHETASYMVQTARAPGGRDVYPCAGAVVSLFKGYNAGLSRADSALHRADRAAGAVFRGRLSGVALPAVRHRRRSGAKRPSPWKAWSAQGISDKRQKERRELLHQLDTLAQRPAGQRRTGRLRAMRKRGLRPDPGRRRQGVRSLAGKGRVAGSLRPQHVRAIVPGGAAAGGTRRALHHHQLQRRLGHAQGEFPNHAPPRAGNGQGHGRAACRICPSAGCWTKPSSGGAASLAALPKSCGKRPGTAAAAIMARSFPPWSPAAVSRAATWSALPTPKGKRSRTRPVYPCDLLGSMYELLGIDPEAKLPHPAGSGCPRDAHRRGRRETGRTIERNHVKEQAAMRMKTRQFGSVISS